MPRTYITSFILLFVVFGWLISCDSAAESPKEQLLANEFDLPSILKRGKLRVLAENSATSFFIYRGKQMGFEYEILHEFADNLGVELEIIRVNDLGEINEKLNNGEGDLIACNYTVTRDLQEEIAFSRPYFQTREVLVQRKRESLAGHENTFVTDPLQLARKTIDVRKNSTAYNQLIDLQNEVGDTIFIRPVNSNQGTEELMELVSDGQIDYTVADDNLAGINEKFYDNLDISVPVSFRRNVAFGLHKQAPILKKRLDTWLKKFTRRATFAYIKRKYFDRTDVFPDNASAIRKGELSAYDDLMKRLALKYNFDWHLLAAIIQHESRFNANAHGFGGAYGLMQFMPGVGSRYGVYPHSSPEDQVTGGLKCILNITAQWEDIPDQTDRYKFMLASYNAGSAHIKDAQRLAAKKGLNPKIWDDNVEEIARNLGKSAYYSDPVVKSGAFRGGFTCRYVREIMERFETFKSMYP